MNVRTIKVGLDYGTSASKIVFWDEMSPGKPKSYIIQKGKSARISSSIALTGDTLNFGLGPDDAQLGPTDQWYESVKMRLAAEASQKYSAFCYGGTPSPPQGFTFQELAILTLWFLRTEAERVIAAKLKLRSTEFRLSVIVGIPRCFYENETTRNVFLDIAVKAHALQRMQSFPGMSLSTSQAKEAIRSVAAAAAMQQDYRDWLRSESEAAMYWPVRSPEIPGGSYAEIDIGAGTTNASIVGIWSVYAGKRWLKQNLGFHGAFSRPVGTDAIDAAIAAAKGLSKPECLRLRGQERELLQAISARHMQPVYDDIYEAYQLASRRAAGRLTSAEQITFPKHEIFFTGGGSLIPGLQHALSRGRRVRNLEPPSDLYYLDETPVRKNDLVFLSVAYGLSFGKDEVPAEYTCEEESRPMPKVKGMSVIYEK